MADQRTLQERAEQCRRLAKAVTDTTTADRLRTLAEQYEAEARTTKPPLA